MHSYEAVQGMRPSQSFITKAQNHWAGRGEPEVWAGSVSDEFRAGDADPSRLIDVVWPRAREMDRMTFLSSRPARWV